MAYKKITQLLELTTPAQSDVMPIVSSPSASPVTKKMTVANLKKQIVNPIEMQVFS